jgi:hypothetical protein
MAQIFLSHHSGDRVAVDELCDELERNGYGPDEVFMDRRAADGVGDLPELIAGRIRECELVVFCVSDAALGRDWFQAERSLAYETGRTRGAVFVKVGPLAAGANFRGPFFNAASAFPIDLTDGFTHKSNLRILLETIAERLSQPEPVVLPAAILALERRGFDAFIRQLDALPERARQRWRALQAICSQVGMVDAANRTLIDQLAERYGETTDDFAPFDTPSSLKALVGEAIKHANTHRAKSGLARIHLRWLHRSLLSDDEDERRTALAEFAPDGGHSLAFIDSLSALDPGTREKIDTPVADANQARSAVVWVPPHSRHLGGVARNRAETAGGALRLSQWFNKLEERLDRSFAFDIADPIELQQWIHQLMRALHPQSDAPKAASLDRQATMKKMNQPSEYATVPKMGTKG